MGTRGRPSKNAVPLSEAEQARRLRSVRAMLAAGCRIPQVRERFGLCEEAARALVKAAREDGERGEQR